ncbi:MAG TPA: aminotransferase class V-fold PLP-dependent enzyme, partial [Candidatus Paceibacterota bacterium]|nr:aminotransferase class V-fold PLP-dependent enzyme [Candidatus Paceibacterota bacterium]
RLPYLRKSDFRRAGLHVDASQAPFTEKLSRSHYGADMLTLDGNKVGARGAGCLVAHRTIPLAPLYAGGGQERGLRSGTENVEAIEEFAVSLGEAAKKREEFKARAAARRAELVATLSGITGLSINEGRAAAPHIVNLSLPGRDTDYLCTLLDAAGFAVSTKSACESGDGEGSRAVLALTGDPARAAATLRISFDASIPPGELARFARALAGAAAFIDSTASGAHD